jgi:hypothetical protein
LNGFYCSPCPCGHNQDDKSPPMVPAILSGWDLDDQQELFKLTMISNVAESMAEVGPLQLTRLIPLQASNKWSMHHSCYLILFLSFWNLLRESWFMRLNMWKTNVVWVLSHFWKPNYTIAWTLICNWLLLCVHISFLHLTTFLPKLHIIHGQTFSLQMGRVDMLELEVLGFAQSLEGAHASYNMTIWESLGISLSWDVMKFEE